MDASNIPRETTWRGQRLLLRSASLSDVPEIVAFHRSLHPVDTPDSPEGWFSIGGPWMHERYCGPHVRAYQDLGWDAWVVTLNEHEVAGWLEVLYTQEPEPFGRYAHLEILELAEGLDTYEIEDWLIGQCEERARSRGYYRFWCRPEGSGGQVPVLQRRGYTELWRNAHLRLRSLDTFQPPRHRTRLLRGDYSTEASHLLALNHRESAEYRWRYLWRPVLSPEASDFPIDVSFWGAHVTTEAGVAGVCLVNIWRWRDPKVASADIWIDPSAINETESVSGLVAIAAGRASEMGAETLDLYAPEALTPKLTRENVELLPLDEMGDPWLCKELSKIN